jgi:hypothetical protein
MTNWIFGIVAAAWLLVQFFLRREAEPGAELQLDVYFVGRQHAQRLIEVVATLANRSFVRHRYADFRVNVRYLMSDDPIVDGGPELAHQIKIPRTIDARIGGTKRYFANAEYIDPRLTFRHSYVTFVPADATFLLVQCSLEFPTFFGKPARKNIQRLVRVPPPFEKPEVTR